MGLKTLLKQVLSEPEFYGDLMYKFYTRIVFKKDNCMVLFILSIFTTQRYLQSGHFHEFILCSILRCLSLNYKDYAN